MNGNIPRHVWVGNQKLSVRTAREKFPNMFRDGKEANTRKISAYGIAEEVMDADQLLDGFLLEKSTVEEDRKHKRAEKDVHEANLVFQGEKFVRLLRRVVHLPHRTEVSVRL